MAAIKLLRLYTAQPRVVRGRISFVHAHMYIYVTYVCARQPANRRRGLIRITVALCIFIKTQIVLGEPLRAKLQCAARLPPVTRWLLEKPARNRTMPLRTAPARAIESGDAHC